jgi:hypothetical protein
MGGKEGAVVKSPVPAFLAGGVAVTEVETDIRRPAEQVFDYVSDPANEPEWNIRMTRLEKLTSGHGRRWPGWGNS